MDDNRAEAEEGRLWQLQKELAAVPKRFVFDIDGVIAKAGGMDYSLAEPNVPMVQLVNRLYEQGHTIILLTARGYVTGMDWREVTERQLAKWGLKYHELHFGKPNADYYVDDRMLDMGLLLKLAEAEAAVAQEQV